MSAIVRLQTTIATIALALGVGGCPLQLGPSFGSLTRYQLSEVRTKLVAPSPGGTRWLLLNSPYELRVYEDFEKEPALHSFDAGVEATGWIGEERVFLARSEDGSAPSDPAIRVVEFLDDQLRTQTVVKLPSHDPELSANMYAVSPSGRFIAVDSAVYDTQSGSWLLQRANHAAQSVLEFIGDEWVLTGSYHDEVIRLRRLRDKLEYERFMPEGVTSGTFDPASRVVFVGTRSNVYAWNVASGDLKRAQVGAVETLRLCDGGRTLAVLGERHLWLLETRTLKTRLQVKLRTRSMKLAADRALIAVGDDSGVVYAFDARAGKMLASAQVFADPVLALAVHAATHRVVASSARERISSLAVLGLPKH